MKRLVEIIKAIANTIISVAIIALMAMVYLAPLGLLIFFVFGVEWADTALNMWDAS